MKPVSITANLRTIGVRLMLIGGGAWIFAILMLDSMSDDFDANSTMVAILGFLVIFLPVAVLIGATALVVGAAIADIEEMRNPPPPSE
jgi:hypothetical protein